MSQSRIPSPARSHGTLTPRRHKSGGTRSVGSPARSTTSGRLSAVIQIKENNKGSFALSPAPSRRSVLNDDTYVEEPRRRSWWKKLGENSRDVMEVLNDNKILGTNEAVEEYIDIEVLSQEKKNYTMDLPDSSDSESISSIVIPQRKLFTQKDLQSQNKFGKLIGTRESLAKLHKSNVTDKTVHVAPKNLFNQNNRARSKPVFPAALLNISPNKTANKTKEMVAPEPKAQVRSLFGNRAGTKRKNMFADFIVSDSEEEIPDIQPKVFGFPKKVGEKRNSPTSRDKHGPSPTSSVTDIEMDDWQHLPSSTMVENQIEEMLTARTPVKRPRLSKLTDIQETDAGTGAVKEKELEEEQELKYDDDDAQSEKNYGENKEKETKHSRKCNEIDQVEEEEEQCLTEDIENNQDDDLIQNKDAEKEMDVEYEELAQNLNKDLTQTKMEIISKGKNKTLNQSKTQNTSQNRANNISLNKTKSVTDESNKTKTQTKLQNRSKKSVNNISQSKIQETSQNKDGLTGTNDDEVDCVEQMEVESEKDIHEGESNQQPLENNINAGEQVNNSIKENRNKSSNAGQAIETTNAMQKEMESGDQAVLQVESKNKGNERDIQSKLENVDEDKDEGDEDNIEESGNQNTTNIQSSEDEEEDVQEDPRDESEMEPEESEEELNYDESEEEAIEEDQQEEDDERQEPESTDIENQVEENVSKIGVGREETAQEQRKSEASNKSVLEDPNEDKVQEESEFEANDDIQNESAMEVQDGEDEEEMQNESAPEARDNVENEEEIQNNSAVEATNDEDGEEIQNESAVEAQDVDEGEEMQNESDIEDQNDDGEEIQNESAVETQDDDEEIQNESAVEAQDDDEEIENKSAMEAQDDEEEDNDSIPEAQDSEEEAKNQSEEELNYDESEEEIIEEDQQEEEQSETEDAQNSNHTDGQDESENEIQNSNEQDEMNSDNATETPNVTHDTTGRYRKKNESKLNSPEAILHDKTNQMESFTAQGRNTSIRKTTMLKNLNIRPSLAPPRESTGMSDGTRNSSAEGSGWDSHRTTRKTLRQTLGREFTPRKSLRAMVMEKSAKRQTAVNDLTSVTSKFPEANSTELPEASMAPEDDKIVAESDHEVSKRTRQTTLEMYLQKIKKQNIERKMKMEEAVRNSLKAPTRDVMNPFKVPAKPMFSHRKTTKQAQSKPKAKPKSTLIPLDDLPQEVIDDMKYKPPKRFQPSNAAWITKRLYKFLETKLEAKYDYKARVRAEKLVESIYHFAKDLRRLDAAPGPSVDALKQEMARLDVVRTHFDFYQFFQDYMPREIRVKVVPDVVNKIGMPRHGVFSDILRGNTVQG